MKGSNKKFTTGNKQLEYKGKELSKFSSLKMVAFVNRMQFKALLVIVDVCTDSVVISTIIT